MKRRSLARRLPPPVRRGRSAWRWCVKGGGNVTAVLARNRVALVVTTARRHRVRTVRPGVRIRTVRRALPRRRKLGRTLIRARPRSSVVIGLRRAKVRFVAVAPRRTVDRPRTLRRRLRQAGYG